MIAALRECAQVASTPDFSYQPQIQIFLTSDILTFKYFQFFFNL
jgi:hypothetical protein